jgi:hypothetical protein
MQIKTWSKYLALKQDLSEQFFQGKRPFNVFRTRYATRSKQYPANVGCSCVNSVDLTATDPLTTIDLAIAAKSLATCNSSAAQGSFK